MAVYIATKFQSTVVVTKLVKIIFGEFKVVLDKKLPFFHCYFCMGLLMQNHFTQSKRKCETFNRAFDFLIA